MKIHGMNKFFGDFQVLEDIWAVDEGRIVETGNRKRFLNRVPHT